MARIIISGIAGFIGSNLAKKIYETSNFEVIGIDNFSHGSLDNLEFGIGKKRFEVFNIDITDLDESIIKFKKDDILVHLAAGKIPRYANSLDTLLTNGIGSNKIFQLASKSGCKIIAASTSDVYGKNPRVPFNENSDLVIGNPNIKRWSYAASKIFEEQLLYSYCEKYKNTGALLRFFGVYGENQSLDWLGGPIPVFIEKAILREAIPIHGDGSQTRSFTYIDDNVDAILNLTKYEWKGCTHLNLGSTEEISIKDLARLIWGLVNGNESPKIEIIPYTTFGKYEDVMKRVPNSKKAKKLLKLKKQTALRDGLRKTIAWQKKFYE